MSLLITLEGIDGSGKTTLINNLQKIDELNLITHTKKIIEPNLQEGKLVIIDRYIDSTFVYQGLEGEIGINNIQEIAKRTIGLSLPDITFILDIDPLQAQARLKKRKLETERIYIINAERNETEILAEVQTIIKKCLPEKDKGNNLPKKGETPETAAKRELFEETNLVVKNLEKVVAENFFYANLPKDSQH
ncbi:3307_t:CDS:2 [Ambispora gerdemannii]|uniref:dTMP kinase n=1 Tax=Ambispora gerdemannii TaxID=144530 RepID=A0A9N9G830_9GLOM|nr:3307_t:CDS:2 [Ambispora gerdemannii]